jgi:hypothetical protein
MSIANIIDLHIAALEQQHESWTEEIQNAVELLRQYGYEDDMPTTVRDVIRLLFKLLIADELIIREKSKAAVSDLARIVLIEHVVPRVFEIAKVSDSVVIKDRIETIDRSIKAIVLDIVSAVDNAAIVLPQLLSIISQETVQLSDTLEFSDHIPIVDYSIKGNTVDGASATDKAKIMLSSIAKSLMLESASVSDTCQIILEPITIE